MENKISIIYKDIRCANNGIKLFQPFKKGLTKNIADNLNINNKIIGEGK